MCNESKTCSPVYTFRQKQNKTKQNTSPPPQKKNKTKPTKQKKKTKKTKQNKTKQTNTTQNSCTLETGIVCDVFGVIINHSQKMKAYPTVRTLSLLSPPPPPPLAPSLPPSLCLFGWLVGRLVSLAFAVFLFVIKILEVSDKTV